MITLLSRAIGINLQAVHCPRCRTRQPALRQPMSQEQMLWGGWTCAKCGLHIDKWGRSMAKEPEHR